MQTRVDVKDNWLKELDIKEQKKDTAILETIMPTVYRLLDALEDDNPERVALTFLFKSILSFCIGKREITETDPDRFTQDLQDLFDETDKVLPEIVFAYDPKEIVFTGESIGAFYKLKTATDWKRLSPMGYSILFETLLEPKERREGGMHYTSAENIHKLTDALFLEDLVEELDAIKRESLSEQIGLLEAFRDKLSQLTFLDPAAGSGNFLFMTYQDLRRLENKALKMVIQVKRALEMEAVCNRLIGI